MTKNDFLKNLLSFLRGPTARKKWLLFEINNRLADFREYGSKIPSRERNMLRYRIESLHSHQTFSPKVANYILSDLPDLVSWLECNQQLSTLCADEESFRKLTYLLSHNAQPGWVGDRNYNSQTVFVNAMKNCQQIAIEYAGFYEPYLSCACLIDILSKTQVPEDFPPIINLIHVLKEESWKNNNRPLWNSTVCEIFMMPKSKSDACKERNKDLFLKLYITCHKLIYQDEQLSRQLAR